MQSNFLLKQDLNFKPAEIKIQFMNYCWIHGSSYRNSV